MTELRVELAAEDLATLEQEAAVQGRPVTELAQNVLEVVARRLRSAWIDPAGAVGGLDSATVAEWDRANAKMFKDLGEVLVLPQVWAAVEADYQASLRQDDVDGTRPS